MVKILKETELNKNETRESENFKDTNETISLFINEIKDQAIKNYKGTILLVCHEADFYENVSSRIINLEDYAL